MSFGIVEIISLLLGITGFGLHPNPKAPTTDQVLAYAMPEPDVTIHVDVTSVVVDNYKLLVHLPDQPQIKASPEVAAQVRKVVDQIEGARGLIEGQTGIDVSTDISDVTLFGQFVEGQSDPLAIAAVHGKFAPAELDRIAALVGGAPQKINGGELIEVGGNALAVTKDGVMLAGTAGLVKERIADTWKAPKHPAGSTLGNVAKALDGKPVFALALTMSPAARRHVLANLGSTQNFATDLITRHKLASFALYHDGIGWQWIDSSKAGLDAMAELSDGLVDLLRAAEIAPRGFAKIALGGLESYRGTDPRIDDVLANKDALVKVVETYTGDGSFQKKLDKDASKLALNVRLTGRSLSDVLSFGALLPVAAVGVFAMHGGRAEASAAPASSNRTVPVRPVPQQLPPNPFGR